MQIEFLCRTFWNWIFLENSHVISVSRLSQPPSESHVIYLKVSFWVIFEMIQNWIFNRQEIIENKEFFRTFFQNKVCNEPIKIEIAQK